MINLYLYIYNLFLYYCSSAHASCVFKEKIWVVGGRTAEYVTWNLLNSYKAGDVWYTSNGGNFDLLILIFYIANLYKFHIFHFEQQYGHK